MQRALLYQIGHRSKTGGADVFDRLTQEILLAEELGFESVWCLPEAGEAGDFRLGTPEFWLAGLAAKTSKIRLGCGLAGLTPPDSPPIRSAEKLASLDLTCAGRLDLALLPNWNADPESNSPTWDEGFRMLIGMWEEPRFSWTSERFTVPSVDVLPKPVQKPHPPISLVGWSLDHAKRAGSAGLGFLDVSGGVDDALEMHRDAYVEARSNAEPDDLVCVSIYAAVLGDERVSEMSSRLETWSSLGFDQAVLQVESNVEDAQRTRGKIRLMAGEFSDIH